MLLLTIYSLTLPFRNNLSLTVLFPFRAVDIKQDHCITRRDEISASGHCRQIIGLPDY